MLDMAKTMRLFLFTVFVVSANLYAAPKRSKANTKDFTVVNTLIETLDQLGDTCSSNQSLLVDPVEAQKVIDLSLWLWSHPATDKSEMIINIECFSRSNNSVYRKVLGEVSEDLQNEIKNALQKHKEKNGGNA